MYDFIFVGLFAAFMAAAFGYVRLCDRIVQADLVDLPTRSEPLDDPADAGSTVFGSTTTTAVAS